MLSYPDLDKADLTALVTAVPQLTDVRRPVSIGADTPARASTVLAVLSALRQRLGLEIELLGGGVMPQLVAISLLLRNALFFLAARENNSGTAVGKLRAVLAAAFACAYAQRLRELISVDA